jgi:ferredoxin
MLDEATESPRAGTVRVVIDGTPVVAADDCSIVQAAWAGGLVLVEHVGCVGQGVCGACRAMVRDPDDGSVRFVLACETVVRDGIEVSFVRAVDEPPAHPYSLDRFTDLWSAGPLIRETFPEAADCRHCGGCDEVCPRDLAVQAGTEAVVQGRLDVAAQIFEDCVSCGLCVALCPERIEPGHVGLFARRVSASMLHRPANLLRRLDELEREP